MINNVDFANEMVTRVPYVVLRRVMSDHDPSTATQNSQEHGRGVFHDPWFWNDYQHADKRVILQYGNEENQDHDGEFYIGLMKAAEEAGRRVVIFNDSVGTTEDSKWNEREGALKYALAHGHFVGLHAYGDVHDGTYHPMTAWDAPGAWRWYAGRFEHLYGLTPTKPNLILTECGAGGFQRDAGLTNWLRDIQLMNERAQAFPYLVAFNWWTVGGGGVYGFERDKLDDWLKSL